MNNIVECRNIYKTFGEHTALNNVSVMIPKGKIYGLLGPNGAGKTTLIRIINRISLPDTGEIIFDGKPLCEESIKSIGYLPEERGLYKKMKVAEQAIYLARLKGMRTSDAVKELKMWFDKFGISGWWNKKVEELSKGMAQKVQFIITVMHKPSLLILDEPFSGFDPVNAQLIRNEILRLRDEGTTIVLSTHNMESVEELCDNITLINKSQVVIDGGVDEIRRKHGTNKIEVLYRSEKSQDLNLGEDKVLLLDGEDKMYRKAIFECRDGISSADILSKLSQSSVDIVSYRELVPSMNDIFIQLVTQNK